MRPGLGVQCCCSLASFLFLDGGYAFDCLRHGGREAGPARARKDGAAGRVDLAEESLGLERHVQAMFGLLAGARQERFEHSLKGLDWGRAGLVQLQ